jgi:hypothetical protein
MLQEQMSRLERITCDAEATKKVLEVTRFVEEQKSRWRWVINGSEGPIESPTFGEEPKAADTAPRL